MNFKFNKSLTKLAQFHPNLFGVGQQRYVSSMSSLLHNRFPLKNLSGGLIGSARSNQKRWYSEDKETKNSQKISFSMPRTGPLSPVGIGLFEENELVQEKQVGRPKIGGPFQLVDHFGNQVDEKTYMGKHKLIYFGFCHCPDICPDELDKIGEALDILDKNKETKDKITPIFITCDPQRDSPEVIKSYLEEFHPKIIGLTGTIDQVRQACKAYRVYFSKPPSVQDGQNYLVDHSIFTYFMDENGQFVDIYGKERTAEEMAKSIHSYITNN
ncbi:hypothetical protein BB558_000825 [Smittium angustum]|uniref:Thioredoxin domain-containing protein n=1 Tax=Smittium angustum TaxID=133377 RepID=A0A2U1IVD5_SMIAN|nr:hypothetical protein BB558_007308 [Smittium angustum]PWA03032.1 hypothetical protein BB558_000825 [Smittium angustum]